MQAACGAPPVEDGKRFVPFGEQCYRIPVWNARAINASPMFPGFRKRESERSMSLWFENSRFASDVAGYQVPKRVDGKRQDAMLVSLFKPTAEEAAQMSKNKRSMHYDIWYGLRDYTTRKVEPLDDTGFYRMWPLPNGNSWMVVTKVPDEERRDTHLQEDFWIATCHFAAADQRSCTTHLEDQGVDIGLHTTESNLPLREKLAAHVVSRLESWEVPCEG
jgi:hypothetical protein